MIVEIVANIVVICVIDQYDMPKKEKQKERKKAPFRKMLFNLSVSRKLRDLDAEFVGWTLTGMKYSSVVNLE